MANTFKSAATGSTTTLQPMYTCPSSTTGDIYSNGRIYESGTSVVDHATAMAIVFGG